jgi:thiamine biosynthesis lipoprotein
VTLAAPLPPRELALQGASIATSSTRERGAHILDPRTGRPAVAAQASLCIAADPALADAWSTALFVLGAAGLELAEAQGVAALLVDADGRTHANPRLLQRFPQLLRP